MAAGRSHRRRLLGGAGVTGAIVAAALLPAASSGRPAWAHPADCGGVEETFPSHHPHGQQPPLAIGDSTMLLSLDQLSAEGYDANAHGCRQYPEALALIRARKAEGRLPHMVVIALGADGSVTHADIGLTLGLLCCKRLLVLVTNRELGGGSGSDAQTEREEVVKHPGRAKLLDWVALAAGHGSDWFQPDGLHLTYLGAREFSDLLGRAMKWAYPKRKHRHHRRATTTPTTSG